MPFKRPPPLQISAFSLMDDAHPFDLLEEHVRRSALPAINDEYPPMDRRPGASLSNTTCDEQTKIRISCPKYHAVSYTGGRLDAIENG